MLKKIFLGISIGIIVIMALVGLYIIFLIPSERQRVERLNKEEYFRSFRGVILTSRIDTLNHFSTTVTIQSHDTTFVFRPFFIPDSYFVLKENDSLIKIPNSYRYRVKRSDSSFVVECEPVMFRGDNK